MISKRIAAMAADPISARATIRAVGRELIERLAPSASGLTVAAPITTGPPPFLTASLTAASTEFVSLFDGCDVELC